jgi:hypothetical protein
MENIMHIIHVTNKGKMMDMLEKFYIYRETEANNQISKLTVQNNTIFETVVYEDSYRRVPHKQLTRIKLSWGKSFTPTRSESYPRTEAHPQPHMDQQPSKQRNH